MSPLPTETSVEPTKANNKAACENCYAPVEGLFCSNCGQEVEPKLKYFWTVLLHVLDDIFSFDSRAARTTKPLMINPGFLTLEYIQGRRVHYVPPIKLYLFISIIFFISLKFFSIADEEVLVRESRVQQTSQAVSERIKQLETKLEHIPLAQHTELEEKINHFKEYHGLLTSDSPRSIVDIVKRMADIELQATDDKSLSNKRKKELEKLSIELKSVKSGQKSDIGLVNVSIGTIGKGDTHFDFLSEEANQRLYKKIKELEEKAEHAINNDARPLVKQILSKLPQLMFVLLPFFALILKVFYSFSNRLYLEHLTVALHSHSFIFLSFLIINSLSLVQSTFLDNVIWLSTTINWVIIGMQIWVPIYLFIMQKRVYQQSYSFTLLKFSFIGLIYFNVIAMTAVIAFIWGLTDL